MDEILMDKIEKNFVDPYSYLTIASVCMGIFRAKFLPETYSVLIAEKAKQNCAHDDDEKCSCEWLIGRQLSTAKPLEVFGEWVLASDLNIVKKKFVRSHRGLVPPHCYEGSQPRSFTMVTCLFQKVVQ